MDFGWDEDWDHDWARATAIVGIHGVNTGQDAPTTTSEFIDSVDFLVNDAVPWSSGFLDAQPEETPEFRQEPNNLCEDGYHLHTVESDDSTKSHNGPSEPDHLEYHVCHQCRLNFHLLSELEAHRLDTDHQPFGCGECSTSFKNCSKLDAHQATTGHAAFFCSLIWWCDATFGSRADLFNHQRINHSYQKKKLLENCCGQCKALFPYADALKRHGQKMSHTAYRCPIEGCGSTFTRDADRRRHEIQHVTGDHPKFPCPHCRRHRGAKGFKRNDHLIQHLRNYHNIDIERNHGVVVLVYSCPHEDCPENRPERRSYELNPHNYPFKTLSEQTKHLKEVHDESNFPCPEPYCDKVGGQGYMRKGDLVKHFNSKHGNAVAKPHIPPQFQPEMSVWSIGASVPQTNFGYGSSLV